MGQRLPPASAIDRLTAAEVSRGKLLLLGALLGGALRLPGLAHDFWLDEVWSYQLVREFVSTPLDVLTRLHIDNNHPLNSWLLYGLGEQPRWWVYRLPSLVCAVSAVVMATRIMLRRGVAHGVGAALLVACSYPLIVYASEARGYAPMLFFVFVAVDAHERFLATRRVRVMLMFWVAVVLGFLSHLTFLHAYAGLLLWTIYESVRRRHELPAFALALHAVPLAFLVAFYSVYIRHLTVAGGEPASLTSVIAETLALAVGAPDWRAAAWIAASVVLYVTIEGLRSVWRKERGLFIFFVAAMLVMPAVMVVLEIRTALFEPRFFPRYFLVSITLFLLLFAWVWGEHYDRRGMTGIAVRVLLWLCVAGNLWHTALFIREGRGQYLAAVTVMARENGAVDIRVSSDSDFRTSKLLAFYRRYLPSNTRLTFYPRSAKDRGGIEWRILEDVDPRVEMPAEVLDEGGTRFRLRHRFSFYGLSGAQWTLYRRATDERPSAGRPSS